jgi:hypothetical protein
MNIASLDAEQLASLQARTNSHNAAVSGSLTPQEYLDRVTVAQVNAWVEADYQAALNRIGTAARDMPFENRVALIQQIESQLQP